MPIIQFYPKDASYDNKPGLAGSVVLSLSSQLSSVLIPTTILSSQFFTSPRPLREMKMQEMAGTGTVRVNRTEKAPLKVVEEIKKVLKRSHDVVVDVKLNVTLVQWEGNKTVTVPSPLYGQQPTQKATS